MRARDAEELLLAGQHPPAEERRRADFGHRADPGDHLRGAGEIPAPAGRGRADGRRDDAHDDTMSTERELLYKVLFDMRADINDLKRMISELMKGGVPCPEPVRDVKALLPTTAQSSYVPAVASYPQPPVYAESEEVTDEPPREMTKADMQREQIVRALRRNNGRRREAAAELFMSERTLYRKIKELGIEDNS